MLYGVAALSGLGMIFSYVRLPYIKVLGTWNRRGYTLYLWQNYFFAVVAILAGKWLSRILGDGMALFAVCSLLIFISGTVSGGILVRLEEAFTGLLAKVAGRVYGRFKRSAMCRR